jgi:hypothetical protein
VLQARLIPGDVIAEAGLSVQTKAAKRRKPHDAHVNQG